MSLIYFFCDPCLSVIVGKQAFLYKVAARDLEDLFEFPCKVGLVSYCLSEVCNGDIAPIVTIAYFLSTLECKLFRGGTKTYM